MIEKKIAYFEELDNLARTYELARRKRKERKQQIINTFGWDSKELDAWYEEDNAATYPISQGACKAYRAWETSIKRQEDELEMDDFLWEAEIENFIDALRKAGFESFVFTNQSTAVMENLHSFAKAGCKMEGLCTITRKECRWGEEETREILGIRFTLGKEAR